MIMTQHIAYKLLSTCDGKTGEFFIMRIPRGGNELRQDSCEYIIVSSQ